MEATEVRKLTLLEDRHWWYRERRHLLARAASGLIPGIALDIGAAGGGNTRVLRELAWQAVALEYGGEGAEVCALRGIPVVRADATRLPVGPAGLDLVVAFDVLEHIEDDKAAVRGVFEALRPGGRLLVAVPADPALWSAHDEAVGHVRRYTRQTLYDLLAGSGFEVGRMRSWNVLLRPAVAARRKNSTGSDLDILPRWLNALLHAVVVTERYLPVRSMPGVSLLVAARRP